MQKKLYRSTTQRTIAGVCGGIAEYFNIDVTLVRLLWIILTLPGFFPGIILYIIAALIIPEGPAAYYDAGDQRDFANSNNGSYEFKDFQSADSRNKILIIIGLMLIAIGGFSLLKDLFPSIWSLIKDLIFPVAIITVGGAIIYSASKNR